MLETEENIRIECTIIKWGSMGKGHNSVKHSENLICILTVKNKQTTIHICYLF